MSGSGDHTLIVWDAHDDAFRMLLEGHADTVRALPQRPFDSSGPSTALCTARFAAASTAAPSKAPTAACPLLD